MKIYQKPAGVKRVFVSIREPSERQNIAHKPLQPKPPTQTAKFIRKRHDNSRCHTPDQGGGKPNQVIPVQKPSYRRSLSPFILPNPKEGLTPYFKPTENESLLSIPPIEKEDSLCMPYELIEPEKPQKPRAVRTTIRNLGRRIDLKKGSFSKKQIVSEPTLIGRSENENLRAFESAGTLIYDQSTTGNSRTPSPILPPRNNRCHALSKNFKISKQHLVSEVEKQSRAKSLEKEAEIIEAPWQSILKDLENVVQIKDLSPHQCATDMRRVPIKISRV